MSNSNNIGGFIGIAIMLIVICGFIALVLTVWGSIFQKAGYSFWMCLLMLVPLANLIWLLVFAFSKWPIQVELERYRAQSGYGTGGFPVMPPQPPRQLS